MKVEILTAGRGTRLRPHTYSKPKPLVHVAGKPMLAHIMDRLTPLQIDELIVVTGHLGEHIEEFVSKTYDFPTHFIEQADPHGQAHAIYLTREVATGPLFVVFGDGIIDADFAKLNQQPDEGVIYVQEVEDPSRFGVAVEKDGKIIRLVEKPTTPVSNLAVVGMYYVPDGQRLMDAIEYIIEHNIQTKGEFYLADALQVMIDRGERFRAERINVWEDCGTISALFATNRYLLDNGGAHAGHATNSVIVPPVYIADSAVIEDSVIGPYVSVGENTTIRDARLRDSIIHPGAEIQSATLQNSLIGDNAYVEGNFRELIVGDASRVKY